MKRPPTDLSFDSPWFLDDVDEWVTSGPPKKRARRVSSCATKSVRFASEDEVVYRYMSEEDLLKAWYTPTDWRSFRVECRKIVALIVKCNGDLSCLDEKRHCTRGLEGISACLLRRSSSQRMIVKKVVLAQHAQRERGIEDQAALRDSYLRLSKHHRWRALERAASDAHASGAFRCLGSPVSPICH